MKKETILKNWKRGDDPAVASMMREKYFVTVTRQAVQQWRQGVTKSTGLERVYMMAARDVQQARATAARQTN